MAAAIMTPLKQWIWLKMAQRVPIIGFPFDGNSSFLPGAAEAPSRIRCELFSDAGNLWTEVGLNLSGSIDDLGDAGFNSSSFAEIIESEAIRILEASRKLIALGGDHSITFPLVKAFSRIYPDLNILHFDAHPDLYEDYDGNRYSHASPFARIMEEKLSRRLVQVGIRASNEHQREQARRYAVEMHEMKDWRDDIKLAFDVPLYISIDMDVLDPAFAPGVSHQEPGGLSTRQLITIIQNLEAPLVVGGDIVEFNPSRDSQGITARAAAKILKELAARML